MLQNPSQPPFIKGGARTKSQNSVTNVARYPLDKGGKGDFKFIPYNPKLKERARELRNNQTKEEILFWKLVLKNQDYTFLRQKPIDNFIVDFYCSKLLLVIEIDGLIHLKNKKRDLERDRILEQKYNLKVVRFMNHEILNDINLIINKLNKIIKIREVQLRLKYP
jgi:very-short-patch-repair endonuclease